MGENDFEILMRNASLKHIEQQVKAVASKSKFSTNATRRNQKRIANPIIAKLKRQMWGADCERRKEMKNALQHKRRTLQRDNVSQVLQRIKVTQFRRRGKRTQTVLLCNGTNTLDRIQWKDELDNFMKERYCGNMNSETEMDLKLKIRRLWGEAGANRIDGCSEGKLEVLDVLNARATINNNKLPGIDEWCTASGKLYLLGESL